MWDIVMFALNTKYMKAKTNTATGCVLQLFERLVNKMKENVKL